MYFRIIISVEAPPAPHYCKHLTNIVHYILYCTWRVFTVPPKMTNNSFHRGKWNPSSYVLLEVFLWVRAFKRISNNLYYREIVLYSMVLLSLNKSIRTDCFGGTSKYGRRVLIYIYLSVFVKMVALPSRPNGWLRNYTSLISTCRQYPHNTAVVKLRI